VGDINPVAHFLSLVAGTRRMADAAGPGFVIIDTPGLIEGPGRALNACQIESLCPDVIVALQRGGELEPTLRAYRQHPAIRLAPSPRAIPKSSAARRRAREEAFGAHFAGGRDVVADAQRIMVQRARLFIGEPFDDPRFLYAERMSEGIIAIGDSTAGAAPKVRVLPPDFADHLLCGVLDAQGGCRGLAILERINWRRRRFHLFTPVARGRMRGLQFGDLRLARDGRVLPHKALREL